MNLNQVYFPSQVKKERDQVAAERGDMAALIRFNYKHEAVEPLLELERWGVKLKYLPIADMCLRQNNLVDAEHFLQKAVQNNEENAAYKFALYWEMRNDREKAIQNLMEVYQKPQDKCYQSACQRLKIKYKMKTNGQENSVEQHLLKDIAVYILVAIAVVLFLFGNIILAIPCGVFIYLFFKNRKNRSAKTMLEWGDLQSEYLDYCNELGQEYKKDPDLGPVNADDAENEPQGDTKELDQHRRERDELTIKIHHIKMNHLVQRYYRGEKWLMPILVVMYHLKFDGEKFTGDVHGQG